MILNFSFKNFRSIKYEQIFSLESNSSKLKIDNFFSPNKEKNTPKLLKSAVIYGANASGKSNLIRLIWTVRYFILNSIDLKTGDPIPKKYYDPFLLDKNTNNEPIEFSIDFYLFEKKHRYTVKYDENSIIYEYLGIYNTNWISRVFERENSNEFVVFGDGMLDKKEDKKVPKNHLYLSKIGNSTNQQCKEIYLYFKAIEIWNAVPSVVKDTLFRKTEEVFNNKENDSLIKKINKLISIADTKIARIEVVGKDEKDFLNFPEEEREQLIKKYKYETFGVHNVFENSIKIGEKNFSFMQQESQGTKMLFAIGGLILEVFERKSPTTIFLDEFDNSLHPDLAKFLIGLFHNPKVNKNNSQLVFATHETTLLDSKIFRKDQIWFSEKNKFGETTFFSVKDFKDEDNLRSDMSFTKLYRSGKLGALPNIKKIEFIAEYDEA